LFNAIFVILDIYVVCGNFWITHASDYELSGSSSETVHNDQWCV